MRKHHVLLIFLIIPVLAFGFVFLATIFQIGPGQLPENPNNAHQGTPDFQPEPKPDPILARLEDMSLEEKIGQLVMAGIDEYTNNDHSRKLIEDYHVGGFVLLKQNIQDADQMLTLINSLKETNSLNKFPLFLSIDEEGGRISRMPDVFIKIPASQKIGELNNINLSYQIGSLIGEQLNLFGLNMNFAPVLDVNSNPQNPVIGDRSFGADPELVSNLGIQTMKGLQSQNIISVVKHFPGHGDTSVDSHIGLPALDHDLERLKSLELLPFAAAIKQKVDVIMTAHILLPKIDPDHPASFSPAIISEVLRGDLGFEGVVITDDLTMGAITENYDVGEVAVQAIESGSDIVLVCHDYLKEEAVLKALRQAVETGEVSRQRIDKSVYRILKLKEKYALSDEIYASVNPQKFNTKLQALYREFPSLSGK